DFARPLGGADAGSARWLAREHVRMPDVSVAIAYARYAASSFGQLTIVVPAEHFDRDAAAIAWGEALREALKPMFEHGQDQAGLPPLPSPAAAAWAPPAAPALPASPTAPAASAVPVSTPVHESGDR